MVYFAKRFFVGLTLCHFVLVFFSPFGIAITSLGEERANLCALRVFDRFVLVWFCRFPFPLDVWEALRFLIVSLPALFSDLFFFFFFFFFCSDRSKTEVSVRLLFVAFWFILRDDLFYLVSFCSCVFQSF